MRPFDMALRLVGTSEIKGDLDHPMIQWAHMLSGLGPDQPDETAWCSSFMNLVCFLTGYQRTGAANARSWLTLGEPIELEDAVQGLDVVVFWRNDPHGWQGHVGLFAGRADENHVWVLGGNQKNSVTVSKYPLKSDRYGFLAARRLRAA